MCIMFFILITHIDRNKSTIKESLLNLQVRERKIVRWKEYKERNREREK